MTKEQAACRIAAYLAAHNMIDELTDLFKSDLAEWEIFKMYADLDLQNNTEDLPFF